MSTTEGVKNAGPTEEPLVVGGHELRPVVGVPHHLAHVLAYLLGHIFI